MGRYATSTSISVLMPFFLSGNTTTSDATGTDVWSATADRVEGEVNSVLVPRYDPSTWTSTGSPAIPPLVRKLTEDLTCLYSIRAAMVQDSQIKNPNIAEWERARETLGLIRTGSLKLAYTDGSLVPTRSAGKVLSSSEGYAPTFEMDDEANWKVDQDRLDAVDSDRS